MVPQKGRTQYGAASATTSLFEQTIIMNAMAGSSTPPQALAKSAVRKQVRRQLSMKTGAAAKSADAKGKGKGKGEGKGKAKGKDKANGKAKGKGKTVTDVFNSFRSPFPPHTQTPYLADQPSKSTED